MHACIFFFLQFIQTDKNLIFCENSEFSLKEILNVKHFQNKIWKKMLFRSVKNFLFSCYDKRCFKVKSLSNIFHENQSINKILTYLQFFKCYSKKSKKTLAKTYFIPSYLDFSKPTLLNRKNILQSMDCQFSLHQRDI